nr:uncharacterized protein LOC110371469 [Helicoverpa armigera]
MAGKKYFVVTFLQLPYPYIEKYVCVPQTWVTLQPTAQTILVSYPNENPAITRNRVENNEKSNVNWTSYKAEMKYITDEYDDADTWIATMYDDGVMGANASTAPGQSSTANETGHVSPWNNNLPNGCLQTNTQDPSTSDPTNDHQGKLKENPLNNDYPPKSTLKRKLSANGMDENDVKLLKTIKTEPLDENDNYSSNALENKETYVNRHQERVSPILMDDINNIIDMSDNNNKNYSSSINKTLLNPLANGELAKLLLDIPGNKTVDVSNNSLESSSQKHESECLEFTIKEEPKSPILIDVSDGEEGVNSRSKEEGDKNNINEIPATQADTVTSIQSEKTVNEFTKSKDPDHNLPHNDKENKIGRPSDCEQNKNTQQADEKITDTQRLINVTVTHGILKEKPHKTPENYKVSMQNSNPYPLNTDKSNKDPKIYVPAQDPKFNPENTLRSLIQHTPTVSNEPFKLPQESLEDVNSSAFKVLVQKDEHLNRIIITRSEEPELKKFKKSYNERVQGKNTAQNKPSNTLPVETPSNTLVPAQNPLNALPSPTQRFPNSDNQEVQITRHLNEQAPPRNHYPQNSQHMYETFHRFGHDRLPETIERAGEDRQQNIAKPNKPYEPAKAANPKPQAERATNGPKIKGYLLEDPRTGQVFIHPTAPQNNIEQRPEYHSAGKNKNAEKHKPTPANQASQMRPQRQDNQFVRPTGGTYYPANLSERLPQPTDMHGSNPRPQINSQNPSSVPNSFQPPNYFDPYFQGRRYSPACQDSNYQDSRMQQPPIVRPGLSEIRPMAPPNVNMGYQNCPPMKSFLDDRLSSNPSIRPNSSYEARMEEWFRSLSQKLDFIYAKLSKM